MSASREKELGWSTTFWHGVKGWESEHARAREGTEIVGASGRHKRRRRTLKICHFVTFLLHKKEELILTSLTESHEKPDINNNRVTGEGVLE